MLKPLKIFLKIILIPFIFLIVHFLFNYNRFKIDGIAAEICSLTQGEDTRYSSGFSHYNFLKIKVGMTEAQVRKILGKPLTVFSYDPVFDETTFAKGHFIGLKYADSPSSDNYRLRIIHLDYGKVVRIMGEFYYD